VEDIAPDIFLNISALTKARRTVAEAVVNNSWIDDIEKHLMIQAFIQAGSLWEEVKDFHIVPDLADNWTW
jgi:hypothetical protein